jgi:hypothetical protein
LRPLPPLSRDGDENPFERGTGIEGGRYRHFGAVVRRPDLRYAATSLDFISAVFTAGGPQQAVVMGRALKDVLALIVVVVVGISVGGALGLEEALERFWRSGEKRSTRVIRRNTD